MKLSLQHVCKSYGKTRALTDFTATLTPGIYALLGPNGSGKSTLMNILTDNIPADSGTVTFAEDDTERDIFKMGAAFREKVGFMPQYTGMYPHFTVQRFMEYMATLKDIRPDLRGRARDAAIQAEISDILQAVELSDVSHRRISTLSGGMKQRLSLAQAVLGDPDVLILDEPTAGLDPKQRIAVRNYISRIALNKIVIIATHVVSDVEFIAKHIILLKKGVVIDNAPPSELVAKMEGRVWQATITGDRVAALQETLNIVGISTGEEGEVRLRILSETCPTAEAVTVSPSLEDFYLWTFGDILKEK